MFAKIATAKALARDVSYVTDATGRKLSSEVMRRSRTGCWRPSTPGPGREASVRRRDEKGRSHRAAPLAGGGEQSSAGGRRRGDHGHWWEEFLLLVRTHLDLPRQRQQVT